MTPLERSIVTSNEYKHGYESAQWGTQNMLTYDAMQNLKGFLAYCYGLVEGQQERRKFNKFIPN